MSDTSTETVTLNLDGNFPAAAGAAAGAAEKLAEGLEKIGKSPKQTGGIDHVKSQMDAIATVQAKIAAFDPARTRELDKQERLLAKMKEDALGITAAQEKASRAGELGAAFTGMAGAIGHAKDAAVALHGHLVELRHDAQAFIGEWGGFGSKLAIDATSKKELQGGIGSRLGGDFGKTRRDALKMGIDPDASWEISKKLLGDKFSKEEIPGILKIKAGMDLAGQNGEALITELQKLKLEPKIKSSDIDRLYKMGIDSKLVYADLAKRLGTDVPTAMAKVKAGTVDTGEAIKSITKVANEKFGGFTDLLGNTIPALFARVKGLGEDLFDRVDISPVKKLLKDVIADIEGPQGARLKDSISRLFGAVFRTDIGGKNTVDKLFDAVTKGADYATAAVKRLQPAVDRLLRSLEAMEKRGAIKSLVDVGEDAARKKIEETQDKAKATTAKAKLGSGQADWSVLNPLEPLLETSETYQKAKRMAKGARKSLGTETDEDLAEDKAEAAATKARKGGKAGDVPLLLNGGGDQAQGAMDAGGELPAGMAEGIRAGESEAIQAAADMAEKSLQAAKDKLLVKSPSEAFAEVGDYSAEGMSGAMASHPGPEAAGRKMASNALGAAKGEAGKAGAAGASGGGGGGPLIGVVNLGHGATDEDLARFEAICRKVDRARREGGSLPAYP